MTKIINTKEAPRPSLGSSQERHARERHERHSPAPSHNNRKGGSGLPHYLMMELRQSLDQNRPSCPTWRRFVSSVLLEDSQVTSATLRPSCAPPLDENLMRSLPLGIQGGFPLAQRCRQFCLLFLGGRTAAAERQRQLKPIWKEIHNAKLVSRIIVCDHLSWLLLLPCKWKRVSGSDMAFSWLSIFYCCTPNSNRPSKQGNTPENWRWFAKSIFAKLDLP